MISQRAQAFWVGIFVIAALIIAGWLLLFLRPSVGDGEKLLRVRFSNIEKISVGTRVTFAGKPVGEVIEINEIYDARSQPTDSSGSIYFFELILRVDSSVNIYTYDQITFSTSGLLGEKTIAIIPKNPPSGKPPAIEITDDILYAKSTDPLTDTLNQLNSVAGSLDKTLEKVGSFIDDNKQQVHQALTSFTCAAEEIRDVAARASETDLAGRISEVSSVAKESLDQLSTVLTQVMDTKLVSRMSSAFQKADETFKTLRQISNDIVNQQGSLGRLLYSDQFYIQFTGLMTRLDTTLSDINNYGLLFQYDKKWQRKQARRNFALQQLCTPCDFYRLFSEEMSGIYASLQRVNDALETAECQGVGISDPCFTEDFADLMRQVNGLQETLHLYSQSLNSRCQ